MRALQLTSVYFSGFLVGVALVLFPAAGNLFVDTEFHGFTSSQYGNIFLPQIVFAIVSSLSAPKLAQNVGMKKVMLYGLLALAGAMLFLTVSHWFMKGNLDYALVLLATACMGLGFGFVITALNPFAYCLFPGKETSAVTAMHIMLGLGTATSAILLNFFFDLGIWWGAPALVTVLIVVVLVLTVLATLQLPAEDTKTGKKDKKVPKRILMFAMGVLLYGACEATFGNFGAVFLQKEGGLSLAKASLGLSLFWGGITVGRVLFTIIALKYSTKWLYLIAPFIVSAVFFLIASAKGESLLLSYMALGGLGLSFLFPKTISTTTDEFPKYAALVSGIMVAAIQLGTGVSSKILGSFSETYSLSALFKFSAVYAFLFGLLLVGLMVFKKRTSQSQ